MIIIAAGAANCMVLSLLTSSRHHYNTPAAEHEHTALAQRAHNTSKNLLYLRSILLTGIPNGIRRRVLFHRATLKESIYVLRGRRIMRHALCKAHCHRQRSPFGILVFTTGASKRDRAGFMCLAWKLFNDKKATLYSNIRRP